MTREIISARGIYWYAKELSRLEGKGVNHIETILGGLTGYYVTIKRYRSSTGYRWRLNMDALGGDIADLCHGEPEDIIESAERILTSTVASKVSRLASILEALTVSASKGLAKEDDLP